MWNRQLQLRWTTVALVALIAPAAPAESADRTAKPLPSTYAVRAKRIYTMAEGDAWFIDDGVMLVRDGKVAAVGADIELPPFIRLIEMPDAVIAPGFVLANSSIVEPHAAPDSVGPQFRAADSFNAFANYRQVTAGGVTTVYLNPGAHRLIAGQGAVVKLGVDPDRAVLRESADLVINLGERAFDPPSRQQWLVPPSSDHDI